MLVGVTVDRSFLLTTTPLSLIAAVSSRLDLFNWRGKQKVGLLIIVWAIE